MVKEEWMPIDGFPPYRISNKGRIMGKNGSDTRNLALNKAGFPVVTLYDDSGKSRFLRQVNHLVATAFVSPGREDQQSIWHIDGDLTNCEASNLMWERRDRVLEWNDMHRRGEPKYSSPPVKNNETGVIYANAYECAMAEGVLESDIIWKIERVAWSMFDDNASYRYVIEGK